MATDLKNLVSRLDVRYGDFTNLVCRVNKVSRYGLKVYNPKDSTKFTVITPKIATIISSGRVTMSNSITSGTPDTYGTVIDLPGTGAIDKDDIGVLVFPVENTFKITSIQFDITGDGTYLQNIGYMDDAQTYYKHTKATGAMTSWTAGDLTPTDGDEFDHIAGIFPVAFWDIKGQSTFTEVVLFAATCYLVYDTSETEYIKVYSIGEDGVSEIDYVVTLKNYDY